MAMVAIICSLTSCQKSTVQPGQPQVAGTVVFSVAGVQVALSFGNGTGMYYPYSAYPALQPQYYPVTTVGYIRSLPDWTTFSNTGFAIYDQTGVIIGNAICSGPMYTALKNWFSQTNAPAVVNVSWSLPTMGNRLSGQVNG